MVTEATFANIQRKSAYADAVQMRDGIPLMSWIDINPTELCNRACVFCPRADTDQYPNQALFMSQTLADKLAGELHALNYAGAVVFCGFGEPMLHPRLVELVRPFGGLQVELVTNGDRLTESAIGDLAEAGVRFFVVSMYDGPAQRAHFEKLFAAAGESRFILRDRWHGSPDDFGLKLTNRAGSVAAGQQPSVTLDQACFYPAYSLTVDWNGDVLLCPQDWAKKVRFGNLNSQTLLDVWTARALQKRRTKLIQGQRTDAPCSGCNASGCVHGSNHANAWAQPAPRFRPVLVAAE